MARRLPPVNVSGGILNLKEFRSTPYCLFTLAGFFAFLGLYTGVHRISNLNPLLLLTPFFLSVDIH